MGVLALSACDAMAFQSWFRDFISRLSFLTRPFPLASSLLVIILAVFIWENISHPEWFGTYSQTETGPNGNLDGSGLTPEEQAAIADIDNLTVLLEGLDLDPLGRPNVQIAPETDENPQNLLEQDLLALSSAEGAETAAGDRNPFEQYISQYQFGGLSPQLTQPSPFSSGNGFGNVLQSDPSLSASDTVVTNPLQQALQQGPSQSAGATSFLDALNQGSVSSGDANALSQPTGSDAAASASDAAASPGSPAASQSVTVPGIPFPVLSPTVQTSPPPGTTGYTPPASLNPTSQPSGSSLPGAPSVPGAAGVPRIPSATGQVDFTVPQVDVGNGSVAPTIPPATAAPATPQITPSPFSVPRPPGSVIGGGYINTFGNPSAPPEEN